MTICPSAPDVEPLPAARRFGNAREEAESVARWLVEQHRSGEAWRDLCVAAPGKRNWRDPLAAALAAADVPFRMLLGHPDAQPDFAVDQVHVMTLHAVQRLRFGAIAIVGIGDLPWKQQTLDEVSGLLTGAMGSASRALAISHSKDSALVAWLTDRP